MRSLYIYMSYYRTYLLETHELNKSISITNIDTVNCSDNLLIGRLNKVEEFVDYLALKIKTNFKKSMNNIVLVLPSDFVVETLTDATSMDAKDPLKSIKQFAEENRHVGFNAIKIFKLGKNIYNNMYLTTEFDGKRLEILLNELNKKGVHVKQVLSPLNAMHHLSRCIVSPFEVVNLGNNNTNVQKNAILCINSTINRTNYVLLHNNLPLSNREGLVNFMPVVNSMSKLGVPFSKVIRLLNLKGVVGMEDTLKLASDSIQTKGTVLDDMVLNNLTDLEKLSVSSEEENKKEKDEKADDNIVLILDNASNLKSKKQLSMRLKLKEYENSDMEEDKDSVLSNEETIRFENSLIDVLINLKAEIQKTINYFSNSYNLKISDILIVSPDILGLNELLGAYSGLNSHVLSLQPNDSIELDDLIIKNETQTVLGENLSILLGASLSNNMRGNVYE